MASPVSTSASQPAVQTVHVLQQIPAGALSPATAVIAQPATIINKSELQENGEHAEVKGEKSASSDTPVRPVAVENWFQYTAESFTLLLHVL